MTIYRLCKDHNSFYGLAMDTYIVECLLSSRNRGLLSWLTPNRLFLSSFFNLLKYFMTLSLCGLLFFSASKSGPKQFVLLFT